MQRIAPTTKNFGALNFNTTVVEKSCVTHYLCLQHLVLAQGSHSVFVEPVGTTLVEPGSQVVEFLTVCRLRDRSGDY